MRLPSFIKKKPQTKYGYCSKKKGLPFRKSNLQKEAICFNQAC